MKKGHQKVFCEVKRTKTEQMTQMNNITKIAEQVAEEIKMRVEEEDVDVTMTELERMTRQVMQEVGREALGQIITAKEGKYVEGEVGCKCGGRAKYERRREGCFHTMVGKVKARRAYYVCQTCREGVYPLDVQLGLRPNAFSAERERLVAMTGVQLPFEKGSKLFEALTLLTVSDQGMSTAGRRIGMRVTQREATLQANAMNNDYLQQLNRTVKPPRRLYGAIDAAKVNIRGDNGENGWRDLKIGAWFEARGKPPNSADGQWRIEAENIEYYADIGPAYEFSPLVWATAVQQRAHLAHQLVILGDGAEWIWNIVQDNFPNAIQILDWFHASEHLAPVAQLAFSDETKCSQWIEQMCQLMWDGKIDDLIDACRTLAQTQPHPEIERTANYFQTHRQRMRYDYFRAEGLQIGSGTIESAAKQIGLMRMKVPGARWNLSNAILIAKARASFLSHSGWDSLPLAA